jgi:hypothetical protein
MAVTIEDVVEAATNGVLRALDARKAAHEHAAAHPEDRSATAMVSSAFFVDVHIICGGYPPYPVYGPPQKPQQPTPVPQTLT